MTQLPSHEGDKSRLVGNRSCVRDQDFHPSPGHLPWTWSKGAYRTRPTMTQQHSRAEGDRSYVNGDIMGCYWQTCPFLPSCVADQDLLAV